MKRTMTLVIFCMLAVLLFPVCAQADTVLPAGVQTIEAEAFLGDSSLDVVVLPEGVLSIGSYAFAGSGVTTINLPSSITSIANNAFSGCSSGLTAKVEPDSYAYDWCNAHEIHVETTQSITPGFSTAVIENGGDKVRLRFVPETSGLYMLTSSSTDDTEATLYNASNSQLDYDDDGGVNRNFRLLHNLTAGNVYYFEIGFYSSTTTGSISLNLYQIKELSLGGTTASIDMPGTSAWFRFVPAASGYYKFSSSGDFDTRAWLYDDSWEQVTSNDDSGEGRNFLISEEFTAGSVYYFEINFYYSSVIGNFPVALSPDLRITQQPSGVSAEAGETVTFSVTANGIGTLSYQWQELASNSSSWQDSTASGSRTNTLRFTAGAAQDGKKFRCIVSDSYGNSITSSEVSLYIESASSTKYRALLIAEADYTDGNTPLPGNLIDVSNVSSMLSSIAGPTGGRYTVYGGNNEYKNSSPSEILDLISTSFSGAAENDVSLFYITAHGVDDLDGAMAGAIGTVRTTPGRKYYVSSNSYYDTSDNLLIQELADALSDIPGKVIVFIDTCGSGAGIYASGVTDGGTEDDFDAERFNDYVVRVFAAADEELQELSAQTGELRVSNKFYVMTSSAHKESSIGGSNGSLFTNGFIEGVGTSGSMPADENSNGVVTLNELYSYTYNYCKSRQTVQVYPTNSSYELFKR